MLNALQVCGMAKVETYGGILAYRFFLGLIEAGFLPGVLYLMTCWYKRNEIGMLAGEVKRGIAPADTAQGSASPSSSLRFVSPAPSAA